MEGGVAPGNDIYSQSNITVNFNVHSKKLKDNNRMDGFVFLFEKTKGKILFIKKVKSIKIF
jgi:hypothetical protein